MNGADEAVELIARNRVLLGQALEARLRAGEAVETAKRAVQRVMHAMSVAEQRLQATRTPTFHLHPRGGTASLPLPLAELLRDQASKARRYARELAGDRAEKQLRNLADELDARAARIDHPPS